VILVLVFVKIPKMSFITRPATTNDLPGILALQSRYLLANLAPEARSNGFVTTPFTEAQILDALALNGVFVAEAGGEIIAYAYAAPWSYWKQWPMFEFMVGILPESSFLGTELSEHNCFQYGPVCVDEAWRSAGVFQHLFECLRLAWAPQFRISATFINVLNPRSLAAHTRKLHWEVLREFSYNNNLYYLLACDMERSVLEEK
jgi:hypothetical protein